MQKGGGEKKWKKWNLHAGKVLKGFESDKYISLEFVLLKLGE